MFTFPVLSSVCEVREHKSRCHLVRECKVLKLLYIKTSIHFELSLRTIDTIHHKTCCYTLIQILMHTFKMIERRADRAPDVRPFHEIIISDRGPRNGTKGPAPRQLFFVVKRITPTELIKRQREYYTHVCK